jgi:opacity protein-like surface antigen
METTAMKILIAATALAVFAAASAFAASQQAQAQTYSKQQTVKKKAHKARAEQRAPHVVRRSPYSTNPANDAYVNGVYVGSDPDPRVRSTLKREYCEDSVDGCGAP